MIIGDVVLAKREAGRTAPGVELSLCNSGLSEAQGSWLLHAQILRMASSRLWPMLRGYTVIGWYPEREFWFLAVDVMS